jgi:hypothetical protein
MKFYNWNGKKEYNACEQYNWRLKWLEETISKRLKGGEVFQEQQYERWYNEEELSYQNSLKDLEKIKKLQKDIAIIVPTHFYQSVWLKSCLESCQKTGYFTLMAYDNPFYDKNQLVQTRLPSISSLMLADEILIKHKTWSSGVAIPHFWNMWYGLRMLKSLGFKYVFNINGDCIMEKPEGIEEIIKILGENDIISCEYHKNSYIGTMSWLAKMDAAVQIWDLNLERAYEFNLGNAEGRFAIFAKALGHKVVDVENPEDHHFKPPGTKGTWRHILGFRHFHAEHKVRRWAKMEPIEKQYFDLSQNYQYLNQHERNTLVKYWETNDKKYLELWWK